MLRGRALEIINAWLTRPSLILPCKGPRLLVCLIVNGPSATVSLISLVRPGNAVSHWGSSRKRFCSTCSGTFVGRSDCARGSSPLVERNSMQYRTRKHPNSKVARLNCRLDRVPIMSPMARAGTVCTATKDATRNSCRRPSSVGGEKGTPSLTTQDRMGFKVTASPHELRGDGCLTYNRQAVIRQ